MVTEVVMAAIFMFNLGLPFTFCSVLVAALLSTLASSFVSALSTALLVSTDALLGATEEVTALLEAVMTSTGDLLEDSDESDFKSLELNDQKQEMSPRPLFNLPLKLALNYLNCLELERLFSLTG